MNTRRFLKNQAKQHKPGESGVALIIMLLLLTLLTALSLSMVMVFSSDMFMNAYNRTFRASNYAADAGITIVRQDIINRLYGYLPVGGPALGAVSPLTVTNSAAIVTTINTKYGSSPVNIYSASSFPEQFQLQNNTTLTLISCEVDWWTDSTLTTKGTALIANTPPFPVACPANPASPGKTYGFKYTYQYTITAVGTVPNTGATTAATESGTITIVTDNNDTINNFSQYGTFIDRNALCVPGGSGNASLVGGTYTGTLFTNGSWDYGQGQGYTFTGKVGSAGADAGYLYSDGTCDDVAGPTDTYGRTTISPNFEKGQQLGLAKVNLPTDEFNQLSAVITGTGLNANGTPSTTTPEPPLPTPNLKGNGASYTGPSDTGVFISANSSGQVIGGGIYVEGDASVTVSASGTTAQLYTITQGSSPSVTTYVTITPGATPGSGTTKIQIGSGTATTYTGVPTQTNPNTSTKTDAAILYVDGNVTSLSGTIQDNTGVTITAADNITITNNLTYVTPVVNTSTGSETAAAAAGTELQALGLYTSGGSVLLKAPTNGANMEVDASIMTTGSMSGTCTMGQSTPCTGVLGVTGSNNIGILNIVGGRIQSQAMIMPSGTIGTRNVYFDPRYNGTFAPPFFPVVTNNNLPPTTQVNVQRTGWVLQTAY